MIAVSTRRMGNTAHPADPRHHLVDRPRGRSFGKPWPVDHHHRQTQPARGKELCLGPAAAGVFGDNPADAMTVEKAQVVILSERPARNHRLCIGQRQRSLGRIDEAQQVVVLRLCGEGPERLLADGEENPGGRIGQGGDGGLCIGHKTPDIARPRPPGRTLEGEKRHARCLARRDGIPAHPGGERVGRVDKVRDAFGAKAIGKPLGATEATDARGQRLGNGRAGTPGVGKDRVHAGGGQRAGKLRGFARTAEKKDARHV